MATKMDVAPSEVSILVYSPSASTILSSLATAFEADATEANGGEQVPGKAQPPREAISTYRHIMSRKLNDNCAHGRGLEGIHQTEHASEQEGQHNRALAAGYG